jgi:hypothetical protein
MVTPLKSGQGYEGEEALVRNLNFLNRLGGPSDERSIRLWPCRSINKLSYAR